MKNSKVTLRMAQLQKALVALEVMVRKPMDDDRSNIDATILRFEFTIGLFWKTLKVILETKGVVARFPKDVLSEAYSGKLIDDEKSWIDMLRDRNLTSHTYDENLEVCSCFAPRV